MKLHCAGSIDLAMQAWRSARPARNNTGNNPSRSTLERLNEAGPKAEHDAKHRNASRPIVGGQPDNVVPLDTVYDPLDNERTNLQTNCEPSKPSHLQLVAVTHFLLESFCIH